MGDPTHVEHEDALLRVLAAAEALAGDPAKARAWLDVRIPEYNHRTPPELVERGRMQVGPEAPAVLRAWADVLEALEVGMKAAERSNPRPPDRYDYGYL